MCFLRRGGSSNSSSTPSVRQRARRERAPPAEFITRANYGLIIGNFELDFEDGEIR
jgi:hypothetical protein